MQIYADVHRPADADCRLAAGAGARRGDLGGGHRRRAAGGYDDWTDAQQRMTSVKEKRFVPDAAAHAVYNELYAIYRELHDGFGGVSARRGSRRGDETSCWRFASGRCR